jgi:hypothetical protein
MIEDANAANNFLNQFDSVVESTFDSISGVANDHRAVSNSFGVFDTNNFATLEKYFINVSVEHESAATDSTDSGKAFGNPAKAVDWVNEGRIAIPTHRVSIELNFPNDFDGGQLHKAFISVESNCVADKINGVRLKAVLVEHDFRRFVYVDA